MDLNVRTQLVSALSGVSGITGGIHFGRTYEKVATPYVVFNVISSSTFTDTTDSYEEIYIQFSAFDNTDSPNTIETIGNDIYNALDGTTLTMNNYYLLGIFGVRRPILKPEDEQYWQCITEFRLRIQKK